jgi:hydrogenase maturation protease
MVTVVSIGNPYRRDDGVGAEVLARVREEFTGDARVRIAELDGEPVRLVQTWEGSSIVWIVDATSSAHRPGTIHEVALAQLGNRPAVGVEGGHAMGIGEAVELARTLGLLPDELRVIGIEGASFEEGEGLSGPVADAAVVAADQLGELIRRSLRAHGPTGGRAHDR